METETVSGLGIGFALALIAGAITTAVLLGRDLLFILASVIVSALSIAVVIGAAALAIRAYRRNDNPPMIEHHYHDGTRTVIKETRVLDGREVTTPEVKLLQLPAQAQAGAFPELLHAAFQAGALRGAAPIQAEPPIEAEVTEIDPGNPSAWRDDWLA